ncbi:MAG: hemolysin family protein, partial [Oscillospiraceae bacterium]
IVTTVVVLIFGEITPKSLAKENPEGFAMAVAPVVNVLNILFSPINFLLVKFKMMISKLFRVKNSGGITENELLTLVDEAEHDGGIDEHESELIRNAIEFNDLEALDIFTPRIDVTAIDVSATNEEIAKIFRETGYSRLPVYEETIDSIVGVINEKDFHNYIIGTAKNIESIMKPAEFIPPSMKISELLKKLQRNKLHIAVLVDEFGGTEGIVTLEDILEELVGEIWDEHDEILASIRDMGDGSYIVPTGNDLDDLFDQFHITALSEASTINGWVIENIDKIPDVGDRFDFDNLTVTVTKAENQRATEIAIQVNFEKEPEEDEL